MANILTYGMKYMRITQNYSGSTSHRPYSFGKPESYPVAAAGKDTERD